ncbi:transcriptional regulator, LuxR family [Thermincola potens JR]|uniref:Transcriptional regulator, LuxR family n=2 Tax=Thermincola TaxID=278993 RepID=D5XBB2_THEPJ|nr:transcriptional regulator, LuxR family [Thermincola potens JR]
MLFEQLKQLKKADYDKFLIPSQILEASYKRCRDKGVKVELAQMPRILSHPEVDKLLEKYKLLLLVAWPVISEDLYPNFTDEDQLIILCNHEGYAVALMSSPKALELCYSMNIGPGTCFREEVCGTNAIALAMSLGKTVVIRGEQHYCRLFKDWSCIAAPLRGPGGDIIGYLDVSMDSEEELGHTLALVQLAVKYIEEKMGEKQLSDESLKGADILLDNPFKLRILSIREREVIRLMAGGQTISEIAKAMRISQETVKTYCKRIYKKLGVNRKSDCLKKARELRLLDE